MFRGGIQHRPEEQIQVPRVVCACNLDSAAASNPNRLAFLFHPQCSLLEHEALVCACLISVEFNIIRVCSRQSSGINGVVVEYIVAIDVTRRRFPADAFVYFRPRRRHVRKRETLQENATSRRWQSHDARTLSSLGMGKEIASRKQGARNTEQTNCRPSETTMWRCAIQAQCHT